MNNFKFKTGCFESFPLHRSAAGGYPAEVQQQLAEGANPYQPTEEGWTALHAAVANKAETVVDLLLARYAEDWTVISHTLQHRFLWKTEQTAWKSRPTLIAWTDEECQDSVALASSCPAGILLNRQVFVLLRNHHQGHRFIALDVCSRNKCLQVVRLIRKLLPNGVLSLDRSDMRSDAINYLQLACQTSTKEIIMKLISKGARLDLVSGAYGRTPFMVAAETMRKDIIDLLTEKYLDRFDQCACDKNGYNALHLVMQRQNTVMTEHLLKSMLHYRTTIFRESKSQALGKILEFKSPEYTYMTTWCLIRSVPMKKLIGRYIKQLRMELHSPVAGVTTLATLITRGIALDYCLPEIEQNLELLKLYNHNSKLNILHTLIRSKEMTFVETLYRKYGPFVKECFENTDSEEYPAFELLRLLLHNIDERGLTFVLKHHRDFYTKDVDRLRSVSIQHYNMPKATYRNMLDLLKETIPELRESVDEAETKASGESEENEFYDHLRALRETFSKTLPKLLESGKQLDDYLDSNRRTFLHAAVAWGDKGLVEKLVAHNMDVMKQDAHGHLPIHLIHRYDSIFEVLLQKNESGQLSHLNEAGHNLLHISCRNGLRGGALEKLLAYGLDVNGPTEDGQLPLSMASCCGTVSYLLDHGARVELLNDELLSRSLSHMHYCAAGWLIPHVAHFEWFRKCAHIYLPWMVGTQSRDFFSCSNQDFLERHTDIRRLLFDCLYEHSKEQTAKLFARVCHSAIICCAKWFMDYDYDIDYNHRHWYNSTPLMGLLSYIEFDIEGHFDVVHKLLRKPIDVNVVDDRGQNALIVIANRFKMIKRYGHAPLSTVRLILQHGAKLDEQDDAGNTALHYAFHDEQWDLVELLIESGANTSLKNVTNEVACEMGRSKGLFGFMKE